MAIEYDFIELKNLKTSLKIMNCQYQMIRPIKLFVYLMDKSVFKYIEFILLFEQLKDEDPIYVEKLNINSDNIINDYVCIDINNKKFINNINNLEHKINIKLRINIFKKKRINLEGKFIFLIESIFLQGDILNQYKIKPKLTDYEIKECKKNPDISDNWITLNPEINYENNKEANNTELKYVINKNNFDKDIEHVLPTKIMITYDESIDDKLGYKNYEFIIKINDYAIRVNLNRSLCNHEIIKNNVIITLPLIHYLSYVYIHNIENDITFELITKNKNIKEVKMNYNYKKVDELDFLKINRFKIPFINFLTFNETFSPSSGIYVGLDNVCLNKCKGFLINVDNAENVSSIELKLNNHTKFKYDKFKLKAIAHYINNNYIYLPFKINDDMYENNFDYGINFAKFSGINFNINFFMLTTKVSFSVVEEQAIIYENKKCFIDTVYTEKYKEYPIEVHKYNIKMMKINLDNNNQCPITFEEFPEDCLYMVCDKCKNNYMAKELIECLKNKNRCPYCTNEWTNLHVFKNKEIDL